jgi:NAD+ diphosphatase
VVSSSEQKSTEHVATDSHSRFALLLHGSHIALDQSGQLPPLHDLRDDDLLIREQDGFRYYAREVLPEHVPADLMLTPLRQLITLWSGSMFELISRGIQLLEWRRSHLFCSRCGSATAPHPHEHAMICTVCKYSQYPRLQPVIIVAITRRDADQPRILLARAANFTTHMFSLIAGFVEVGETLEQAVAREVKEEVGLDVTNIRYISSQPWPFPSNLMVGFQADYAGGEIVLQEEEIAEAGFFTFDDLPPLPPSGSISMRLIEHAIATYPG